jgi:transcriptional regulator with XRE-family HTH domain
VGDEAVRELVRRVVEASGVPQAQIARDADLSYAALHAWLTGLRTPKQRSLLQLAEGLESRSDALRGLAQELRAAAERRKK